MRLKIPLFGALLGLMAFSQVGVAAPNGADRHGSNGVACQACHGQKNKITIPSIDQCRTCHNINELAVKTKNVKPTNPHNSPHYAKELDCALCHLQHSQPENYCNQCHQFSFKVK